MVDAPLYLDDILIVLGWSRAKFYRCKKELLEAGAIFHLFQGSPPQKRIRAHESTLKEWVRNKSANGEMI